MEVGSSTGCVNTWAATRGEGFVFTCNVCREVVVLVKEVAGLRQMVEYTRETDGGQGFEEKGVETGSRVT